jgi:uncharacterized protein (DUF1330 family)
MTAFFVSRIKVSDPAKMQEYAQATGPTIGAHGGKLVLRGAFAKTLIGENAGKHMTSIVEIPDIAALDTWFNSPEYQAHSALRDSAGEMQFVAYEVPAA